LRGGKGEFSPGREIFTPEEGVSGGGENVLRNSGSGGKGRRQVRKGGSVKEAGGVEIGGG